MDLSTARCSPHSKTVLVADDEPEILQFVSSLLNKFGWMVILAHDGPSAIQEAEHHPGKIDLLLSDVLMPGMTGVELAEKILEKRPNTKVLLMTGWPGGAAVRREGWSLLFKPFSPDILKETVQTLFE